MRGCIVLGIPQVSPGKHYHPGGQLTAANGLVEYLVQRGVRHEVLNTIATVFPPVPLWKKMLQSVGRLYRAWRLAAEGRALGFIAFSGFGLSLYERCAIALIYRMYGKPSVIFFRSTEILGRPMPALKQRILSRVLRIPTSLVSQGTQLANELQRLGRDSVEIVPNWLPAGYTVAPVPKSYPSDGVVQFVFVGWLERAKGVRELLEAAAMLQPIADRFRLLLIGNGGLEKEVADTIVRAGLHNVAAPGWKAQAEVIELLGRSHVFILPSHSEGFPNALLEAMAHGLPVIATRVGAIPDSVVHDVNGQLIHVGDADGIAAAMRRYVEEPHLIPLHSERVIDKVISSHSRDANCKKLVDLLGVAE